MGDVSLDHVERASWSDRRVVRGECEERYLNQSAMFEASRTAHARK